MLHRVCREARQRRGSIRALSIFIAIGFTAQGALAQPVPPPKTGKPAETPPLEKPKDNTKNRGSLAPPGTTAPAPKCLTDAEAAELKKLYDELWPMYRRHGYLRNRIRAVGRNLHYLDGKKGSPDFDKSQYDYLERIFDADEKERFELERKIGAIEAKTKVLEEKACPPPPEQPATPGTEKPAAKTKDNIKSPAPPTETPPPVEQPPLPPPEHLNPNGQPSTEEQPPPVEQPPLPPMEPLTPNADKKDDKKDDKKNGPLGFLHIHIGIGVGREDDDSGRHRDRHDKRDEHEPLKTPKDSNAVESTPDR